MSPINNRIKDVLITLAVAKSYHQHLGRLRLQKFIYLADIISLYWGILGSNNGHKTYKNGPYDSDIQNAVDVLAFRGFVSIYQSNIKEDATITASYTITKIGESLFSTLEKNKLFRNRIELFRCIGSHVNQKGWQNLKALVYQEPTYCFNKVNGWGYRLDYSSLLTNDSLRILDDLKKMLIKKKNQTLSRENFTSLYFKLLAAKLQSTANG